VFRITEVLDFANRPELYVNWKTQGLENWTCVRP
jgi:hypothetical protein